MVLKNVTAYGTPKNDAGRDGRFNAERRPFDGKRRLFAPEKIFWAWKKHPPSHPKNLSAAKLKLFSWKKNVFASKRKSFSWNKSFSTSTTRTFSN
jgi:hypothetical protein